MASRCEEFEMGKVEVESKSLDVGHMIVVIHEAILSVISTWMRVHLFRDAS